jgi:hypothetical protein
MIYAAQIVQGKVAQIVAADSTAWCSENIGGLWVEVKKDGTIRGRYPALGDEYDADADEFVPQEVPD